jgi:hypothetical protein
MAEEFMKVRITVEEGQTLLRFAQGFALPPGLGETPYTPSERGLACRDAQLLWAKLKSLSPALKDQRRLCFGPLKNWTPTDNGEPWVMSAPDAEIDLGLTEDEHSGAYWCLLLAVHPSSEHVLGAGSQRDIAWPLATKLRISGELEKDLGLDRVKHRRINLDPVPKASKAGGKGLS